MDTKEATICRVCLNTIAESEYEEISGITKEIFDALLTNMNLDICKNPIICRNCTETAVRCLRFKLLCVLKEQELSLTATESAANKIELTNWVENKETNICVFCMDPAKNDVSDIGSLEQSLIAKGLPILFPEKEFYSIENSKICSLCRIELEVYFTFLFKCMKREESIEAYFRKNVKIDVKLSDIQHHSVENDESEKNNFVCEACSFKSKRKDTIKPHMLTHKDINEVVSYDCSIREYRTKKESNFKNHMGNRHDASEMKKYQCSYCTYEANRKKSLYIHMGTKHNAFEVETHKCSKCTFETKWKENLRKHMGIKHNAFPVTKYKCSICPFETIQKIIFIHHMDVKHGIFEVSTYKCSDCTYESRRKRSLDFHIKTQHSEVQKYKCPNCSYETKWRLCLKNHQLTHRSTSEVKMYKCSDCTYETKWKSAVKRHMVKCKKK